MKYEVRRTMEASYDLAGMKQAYLRAVKRCGTKGYGFAHWADIQEEYEGNAQSDFANAVDSGACEIVNGDPGLTIDETFPNTHHAYVQLDFHK